MCILLFTDCCWKITAVCVREKKNKANEEPEGYEGVYVIRLK